MKRVGGYGLSFLLVLIAGCAGGIAGLWLFRSPDLSQVTLPDLEGSLNLVSTVVALTIPETSSQGRLSLSPTRWPTIQPEEPSSPSMTLVPITVSTPIPSVITMTPIPTPTETPFPDLSVPIEETATPEPTPLPTPKATSQVLEEKFEFIPAGPIRHTVEGCAGQAILGIVYDQAGNPLAGVRLWMYDQWANTAYAQSKAGTTDLGRYDFPLFYTGPAVLYVSVLGPDGSPVSPTIEIYHRQGPQQTANCHWIDWKRVR